MKDNEVQLIIDLREYLIFKYKSLDGKQNPGTSVILQRDVADMLSNSISKIDFILKDYVQIGK